MRMTHVDWALLVALSLLWGGSFFFATVAVREVPPLTVVLGRVAIAAAALWLFLRLTSGPGPLFPPGRKVLIAFLGMGLLNNFIPFSLLFWAQTQIPSGLASILNATTPIFSVIFAHLFLADERMGPAKAFGVALGILGVAVLIGEDAWTGASAALLGMAACLGAACSYGVASVFGRRFRTLGIRPGAVALGQLTASSAMMLPVAMIVDRPWTLALPSTAAMLAIVALALVSTALAYMIYFRILATSGAVNISLVTLLIPPSAILLGALFLGERLDGHHFAGMGLIALGLVALDGRALKIVIAPGSRR